MNPSAIIENALRKSALTQAEFASSIGKSQSTLSKYINGQVQPAASVIIHCMNIFGAPLLNQVIGENELALRVQLELKGVENSSTRMAINQIINLSCKNKLRNT